MSESGNTDVEELKNRQNEKQRFWESGRHMKKKVGIIGGGASGMMAAVTAAGAADVTILEHTARIGLKILSTRDV